jgi:hypothetical protein
MKVKRFDNGGEAGGDGGSNDVGLEATEPASTFYDTYAKNPTANYVPFGTRRNVGAGVAVQEPGAEEARGLLSPSIIPMTGTEMQRALTSYAPGSFGSRLATGYEQLFGRPVDVAGAQYFMNRFGNQNLDQAAVNRILLGGAQGADREAAQDYQLSLTGGRPDYEARMAQGLSPQYMQPIYRSSYQDYLQPRVPAASLFNPGFNPFDYAAPPSDARLGQISNALTPFMSATPVTGPTAKFDTYTGYNPFATGAVNPYATRMSRPAAPTATVMPQQPSPQVPNAQPETLNPFARSVGEGVAVQLPQPANESYLRAYAKGGGIGMG